MSLHLADRFSVPDDFVTQSAAILARRGAGKTYTAKVIAEELLERALPVVVLDPVGVWWGLRSNTSGTKAGYPVTILGGEHGDLPLDAHAGTLVANLVATDPVAVVLDLSGFESKSQQRQFVTDFAERLYRAKSQSDARTPLHLIIDEADEFAPQSRADKGDMRMLGAFETIVRRGRARGLGVTMITQRPAVLNKNVLTQVECLIVMQLTSPQDRKAIGEWVRGNASEEEQRTVDASLASLQQGDAWFWSPGWLNTLQRIHVRKARTFDSSATPKAGEVAREAKVLAPVDLDRLKEGMERVVTDADRNDPRKLHAQIRDLERELKKRPTETVVETVVERVEVPVLSPETTQAVVALTDATIALTEQSRTLTALVAQAVDTKASAVRAPVTQPRHTEATRAPALHPTPKRASTDLGDGKIGKCERAILTVLAQHPDGRTNTQLTTLTGYRYSGGFKNSLSTLRTAGYMTGTNTAVMQITDAGIDALGPYEPLPTGDALLTYWCDDQLGKCERAILLHLVDIYPRAEPGPDVATATGYEFSGGFKNSLSTLRTLALIEGKNMEGVRATDDFIDAIRT